jgi:tetratricopeptide (TPR) repeat protein
MSPDFWVARHYRALAYTMKGSHQQAISELRDLIGSPGEGPLKVGTVEDNPEVAASLAFAFAGAGSRNDSEAILERLRRLSTQRYVSPLYIGIAYTGLNDKEKALEYLTKAYENRHPGLVLIRVDPLFDNLRSHDKFKELVKRFEPIP